jgi:hypothetical protein
MEEADIKVERLGDEKLEKTIHDRLASALNGCPGWRVYVGGSAGNDYWGVRVRGPHESESWLKSLTQVEEMTVETVVQTVNDHIDSVKSPEF